MTEKKTPNSFEYLNAALDMEPFPSPAVKYVLTVIARHRNSKTELCCPSLARLRKLTGLSKETILRALKTLRDSGVISHQKGWGNAHSKGVPNRYTLNLNRMKELAVAGVTTLPTNDAGVTEDDAGVINATSKAMQVSQRHDAGVTTLPLIEKRIEKTKPNGEVNRREPDFSCGDYVGNFRAVDSGSTDTQETYARNVSHTPIPTEPEPDFDKAWEAKKARASKEFAAREEDRLIELGAFGPMGDMFDDKAKSVACYKASVNTQKRPYMNT